MENAEHRRIETNGFLSNEVTKIQNEIFETHKKYDFQTKTIKEVKSQLKVNSNEYEKLEITVLNMKSLVNVLDNRSCEKNILINNVSESRKETYSQLTEKV